MNPPNKTQEILFILRKSGANRHISMQFIPIIWQIPQQSVILQRQNIINYKKNKKHEIITLADMKMVAFILLALWGVVALGSRAQTSLPHVMLEVAEEVSHDRKVSATFTLEQTDEATGSETTEIHKCRVSYSGESSSSYDKKSWNVHFIDDDGEELYVNLLGLRANCSKWILDAAAGDRSRMRNRVAMDVFVRYARLPYETDNARRYCSLGRYVEVWVNGEYKGLFCLTDRINRELLGGTATMEGQTRCVIYNCKNYGSGNYLNPYEEGPADGDEQWNSWEMKYPDEPTAEAWQTLLNLFNVAWDNTPDDDYVATVRRYFYWDNLVEVYLQTLVCGLADMGYKNAYLVCPDITQDSRCVLVPVDMDYTFGCTWNGCYWDEKPQLRGGSTLHFVRPFSHPMRTEDLGFVAALAERWAALRDDALSVASFTALINGYAQLLDESGAWQRERELWNYNPVAIEETAAEAARYMTEWYANSHEAISQLLAPYLPTAVKAVKSESINDQDACYDLLGRSLPSLTNYKGIYIKDYHKRFEK